MDSKIKAILIDQDEQARYQLKEALAQLPKIDVLGESGKLAEIPLLVKEHAPTAIIMDITTYPGDSLILAQQISQRRPDISLVAVADNPSSDVVIQAMRAGIREFIQKPFTEESLQENLGSLIQTQKEQQKEKNKSAKLISLFGAKGGVGSTTLATNIASSLAQDPEKSVLLLDLDFQKGQSSVFLNLEPKYTLSDFSTDLESMELEAMKQILSRHSSGPYLLTGPTLPEEAEKISPEQIDELFLIVKANFDYVIIDTNGRFEEITLKALDESNKIVTVLTPEFPAFYNAKRRIDVFKRMDYTTEKMRVVINRTYKNDVSGLSSLKDVSGVPVYWRIPDEKGEFIFRAVNLGTPISQFAPKAKMSISVKDLAGALNGGLPKKEVTDVTDQGKRILKKLLGRSE